MVFQKIQGGFCSHDDEIQTILQCPVLTDKKAVMFLGKCDTEKPEGATRGIFESDGDYVVFEYSGKEVLVEDFRFATLGYAWLFGIDYGYFKEPKVGWVGFHKECTIPEHAIFTIKAEAIAYVKRMKEQ